MLLLLKLVNSQLMWKSVLSDFVNYLSVAVPNDVVILSDGYSIVLELLTQFWINLPHVCCPLKLLRRRQISVLGNVLNVWKTLKKKKTLFWSNCVLWKGLLLVTLLSIYLTWVWRNNGRCRHLGRFILNLQSSRCTWILFNELVPT